MADKYNRTSFLLKQNQSSPRSYDLLSNSINDFKFTFPMSRYTVTNSDTLRLDHIAIKAYNDINAMSYWWILAAVNHVMDGFNDLSVGQVLFIPHPSDIQALITFNSNRTS